MALSVAENLGLQQYLPGPNTQLGTNLIQGFNGDGHLSSLHQAYGIPVNTYKAGQLLLGQALLDASVLENFADSNDQLRAQYRLSR